MAFSPSQQPRKRKIGEIAMADTPMTDMDEGSKGGRRSVLVFGLVAATFRLFLLALRAKTWTEYTGVDPFAGNQRFAKPVKIINLR
jgi:hypothetical protein